MMIKRIPIFPVGTVLYPHRSLHIHVFEKKFLDMIYFCKKNSIGFGAVFLCGKTMQRVGCIANIENVVNTYSNEKLDILVRGSSRFSILKLFNIENKFPEARVHIFKEYFNPFKRKQTVPEEIKRRLNRFLQLSNLEIEISDEHQNNLEALSFYISSLDIFSLAEKQELLELRCTTKRIKIVSERLNQVIAQRESLINLNNLVGPVEELQYILN